MMARHFRDKRALPSASRPRRSMSRLALSFALLLLAVGVLAILLGGCGSEPEAVETTGFSEALTDAEQGTDSADNPAEFISLCTNCHDRLDRELDWRRDRKLIFNHPAHFANGIRCSACHQEFPHKPGRIVHVSVETCFTCHGTVHGAQGDIAPASCDTCHTAGIAPVTVDHKQEAWVLMQGGAPALHGRAATERRLYCKMCHEQTFCDSCHKMEIPHPVDWVQAGHKAEAPKERAACEMCHSNAQFCNSCHHVSYAGVADWASQHKQAPLKTGAESCFECHEPLSCAKCHVATSRERGVLGDRG